MANKMNKPKRIVSRILSDAQTEKLIAEIQAKPCLWDEKDCNYKNGRVTRKFWHQIGYKLNVSGSAARRKWKSLKDMFRKMIQKQYYSQSSEYAEQPKWRFYQPMLFTKGITRTDIVDPLQIKSAELGVIENSLQSEPEEIAASENDLLLPYSHNEANGRFQPMPNPQSGNHIDDQPEPVMVMPLESKSTETNTHRSRNKVEKIQLRKEKVELERQKTEAVLRLLNHNESDDDYHFLMSLIPYFRILNPLEKLELRSKIQNCVLDACRHHEGQTHNVQEAQCVDNWIISNVETDKTTTNSGEECMLPKMET